VSDESDNVGWMGENDERTKAREKMKKTVWKIVEEESPSKQRKDK